MNNLERPPGLGRVHDAEVRVSFAFQCPYVAYIIPSHGLQAHTKHPLLSDQTASFVSSEQQQSSFVLSSTHLTGLSLIRFCNHPDQQNKLYKSGTTPSRLAIEHLSRNVNRMEIRH